MSQAREIKSKVQSIKSTKQITKAMEMVAASKMRKAQERVEASRPYLERVLDVIVHMEKGNLAETHPYLIDRPVKKVAILVVSTDRGLCGGLNNNLFREVFKRMEQLSIDGVKSVVATIGGKAEKFFSYNNAKVVASIVDAGDAPVLEDLIGIIRAVLDMFDSGEVDQIFVAYNKYISTIKQEPVLDVLLPAVDKDYINRKANWDYIYEPNPTALLEPLLHRYIETLVYQAVVENVASEQAARMVAMRNASDNAQELINDLNLAYNKARQAAITKELSEIVAGAAAV